MAQPDGPRPDVSVLGGGVVGITTAVALELAGYGTRVHTAHVPFEDDGGPTLATPYAAASVLPAYVTMAGLPGVFERSQDVFRRLAEAGSMGVRRQPHFQLSGAPVEDPPVADALDSFRRIDGSDDHPAPAAWGEVHGWRAEICFVEPPTYLRRCYRLYRALGGEVVEGHRSREAFLGLPGEVLVNATGLWARETFDDPAVEAHVGHQVLATGLPPIRGADGRPFSWSYAPEAGEAEGPPGGLYGYPRTDALVLGGTRIPVDVAPGEPWDGADDLPGPTRTVDGVTVPERLIEGNAELLASATGVDLQEGVLSARYGYRPVRDPDSGGVRIERVAVDGRPVVHNYGHGGAGVTLSWGSALEVVDLVGEVVDPSTEEIEVPAEFGVFAGLLDDDRR